MSRTLSPEALERLAEQETRRDAIEVLAGQCGGFVEGQPPGAEKLLLVKATKPDGRRIKAVLRLVNQFEASHLDVTYASPAESSPTSETFSFVLPRQDLEIVTDSHFDIPTRVLEDAAFLTSDLQSDRPRIETAERREVSEISESRYQQLSGQR